DPRLPVFGVCSSGDCADLYGAGGAGVLGNLQLRPGSEGDLWAVLLPVDVLLAAAVAVVAGDGGDAVLWRVAGELQPERAGGDKPGLLPARCTGVAAVAAWFWRCDRDMGAGAADRRRRDCGEGEGEPGGCGGDRVVVADHRRVRGGDSGVQLERGEAKAQPRLAPMQPMKGKVLMRGRRYSVQRRKTREPLVPPKPKELESA